jgi:predicted hydrocarbon binding protein
LFRHQKKETDSVAYGVDNEKGIVTRKIDNTRVITVSSYAWATLERELTTTFLSGGAVILQRMGYSYGKHIAKVAMKESNDNDSVLEMILDFIAESGWGKPILSGGDLSTGQARIALKNCFLCEHVKDSKEPVCHMFVGLIAGISDEIFGSNHRVVESRCVAKGDPFCEVSVEKI